MQYYDWERYYALIRELQPGACISVCGPDVRWCGNEAGHTRPAEWSVVPERTRSSEIISEKSQHTDSSEFRQRRMDARDADLGSRELLADEHDLIWYPAEVNTSIRPGWFWHESENGQVKTVAELADIYMRSVGGNCTFLLNIPPTKDGLLHENDVRTLAALGDFLRDAFAENLVPDAALSCGSEQPGCGISHVIGDGYAHYYMPETSCAAITVRLPRKECLGYLVLKENIRLSQRIERFSVSIAENGSFREIYTGTTVGYQRIVPLGGIGTDCLRIDILPSIAKHNTLCFAGCAAAAKAT